METKKVDSIINKFQKVILKAYGNRPLVRYALKRDDGIIMVKSEKSMLRFKNNENDMDWIGWPEGDIYLYNENAYNKLLVLYETGDQNALNEMWLKQETVL
jgi:hypothetical protein